MMKYVIGGLCVAAIAAFVIDYKGLGRDFTREANAATTAPIVVELYTSQSCSSCPPADKVLSEIAQQPGVIALGCHVTYWNHLHWKDTLSQEECTNRQKQFNGARGSSRIYTPQMVVNGEAEFVGSRRGQAITEIKNATPLLAVSLQKSGDGYEATLPAILQSKNVFVEWIGYDDQAYQDIRSGENGGRSLTYTHPIRSLEYQRSNGALVMQHSFKEKTDNVAVIIRDQKAGKVIAAGQI